MVTATTAILVAAFGGEGGSPTTVVIGLVIAVVAVAIAVLALRQAVRTDAGVPHSLFGLAFALVAAVIAVFTFGAQRGGQYAGQGRAVVRTVEAWPTQT